MLRNYLLSITLLIAPCMVYAQSPAPAAQTLTPAQQRQNQMMERAALQVAQMVDQNQVAQVWDGASGVIKPIVSRDAFIKGVDTDRIAVGTPTARSLATMSYSESDGRKLPPGLFASVAFVTRFAHEKQPVRELVSFHLDNDHVWRVTGYTLR
jgi:hypothetical protein